MMDVQLASLFASGAFIIIGLFAAIFIDNLIKKIIGIAFIEEWGKPILDLLRI